MGKYAILIMLAPMLFIDALFNFGNSQFLGKMACSMLPFLGAGKTVISNELLLYAANECLKAPSLKAISIIFYALKMTIVAAALVALLIRMWIINSQSKIQTSSGFQILLVMFGFALIAILIGAADCVRITESVDKFSLGSIQKFHENRACFLIFVGIMCFMCFIAELIDKIKKALST